MCRSEQLFGVPNNGVMVHRASGPPQDEPEVSECVRCDAASVCSASKEGHLIKVCPGGDVLEGDLHVGCGVVGSCVVTCRHI